MHMNGKRAINGLHDKRRCLRDAPNDRDENIQLCPRIGCSGRLNHTRTGCIPSRQNLNSSNGKEVVGSSSGTSSLIPIARKPHKEYHRKSPSHAKTDELEATTFQDETMVQEQIAAADSSRKSVVLEAGCSSGLSHINNQQKHCNKSRSVNQDNLRGPTVFSTASSVRSGTRSKLAAVEQGFRTPKGSPSIYALPHTRFMKKRSQEGESSSSSVGNRTGMPFSKGGGHGALLNNRGISISEPGCSRSWGSSNVNSRLPRPQTPNPHMLNFSTDTSSSGSSIGQSNNHDALWRYNMDEIAGALLQLERIEQDEELTYEQILALETNVFLNGTSFYDQHRDMRLDIDNMSYEELLALGERMGMVSTALSEEAMSKCLGRSIYQVPSKKGDGDDSKCSICQEEYVIGDEVGKLECEHRYHLACVQQWLKMKNWCPICKASAVPSRPSSPP